jgi:hypothetical protein
MHDVAGAIAMESPAIDEGYTQPVPVASPIRSQPQILVALRSRAKFAVMPNHEHQIPADEGLMMGASLMEYIAAMRWTILFFALAVLSPQKASANDCDAQRGCRKSPPTANNSYLFGTAVRGIRFDY